VSELAERIERESSEGGLVPQDWTHLVVWDITWVGSHVIRGLGVYTCLNSHRGANVPPEAALGSFSGP